MADTPRDDAIAQWAKDALGLRFANPALLRQALTHKSAGPANYERLEFLGDRVLGLVVAEWLFHDFPTEPEGKLTRRFHQLVSRESCAGVARRIGVQNVVLLGLQARSDGGANSDNILGDVMEALIGAVCIDQGMDAAEALIRQNWTGATASSEAPKHPKMRLQEWAAANSLKSPVYRLLGRSAPHHNPRFSVELEILTFPPVSAEGGSKQEAETRAASAFLEAHAD